MPFLDLGPEFQSLEQAWLSKIRKIGESGRFILGPEVGELEREFAQHVGAPFAISVANGTDALILSLLALGVGPGDEVITTPYSFFATAEAVSRVGGTPVFADIDPDFFNLDPRSVEERITAKTRAIIPVHLFGCPADMESICQVAERHGLAVIEDCAQAFGASCKTGSVGSLGDFGCYSFYPTKVLGCYGDGGMITVRSQVHFDSIAKLRNHGATGPFLHSDVGYNSRLDEIQAALLRLKLARVEEAIAARRKVASQYDDGFENSRVSIPSRPASGEHVYNLYTIRTPGRDLVVERLRDQAIGFSVCYEKPLHLQEVYRFLGYVEGDLPVSERASRETLSLPIYPDMPVDQIERVIETVLHSGVEG